MRNKSGFLSIKLIFIGLIIIFVCVKIIGVIKEDTDYKKLDLGFEKNDIEYYTVYNNNILGKYKVYKINTYYIKNKSEDIVEKLNKCDGWNRNKFYEYIMAKFYEYKDNELMVIDRENLYYYHKNNIYAILDLKNSKLYYYEKKFFYEHKDYDNILDIDIKDYVKREIYSVRGGPQNDGLDYYVYKFDQTTGESINKKLETLKKWSTNKLNDDILECFEYNNEVFLIKNGYYYYGSVSRINDEYNDDDFKEEEQTGWQIGIYDVDRNILYYYWTSY